MLETFEFLLRNLSDAENSGKVEKVAEICRRALDNPSVQSDPKRIFRFGIKLVALLLAVDEPIRPADVEEGIDVLKRLLAFVSREKSPSKWAHIQVQLGAAFFREERTLRAAIFHFENALLILRRDQSPKEWALTKAAAGQAYWWLGDKSEQAVAIGYLEEALTVYTREEFPEEYRDYSEQVASWKRSTRG